MRRAFTLIELLVVVAIIALLISILLPSLTCAREQARAARCGVLLRSLGLGMATYTTENQDYFPGLNTTGLALRSIEALTADVLRSQHGLPVQSWDWLTPLLKSETSLGSNRAQRFRAVTNYYRCPTQANFSSTLYPVGLQNSADRADFNREGRADWSPLSYLMPAQFQYVGQQSQKVVVKTKSKEVKLLPSPTFFDTFHPGKYLPRINEIGVAGRKIAASDATRYVTRDGDVDFDPDPQPTYYGAFTTAGGWWSGDESFGVQGGSSNWDGMTLPSDPDNPESQGENLVYTYRHGCNNLGARTAQNNKGAINALFFDGHVARMNDRQSREIEFWYPRGSIVRNASAGMTRVPQNFVVP